MTIEGLGGALPTIAVSKIDGASSPPAKCASMHRPMSERSDDPRSVGGPEFLAARFERLFHRRPTDDELERFRSCRVGLLMRLPEQRRRRGALVIATA